MKFAILLIPLLTLSLVACNSSETSTENDVAIADTLIANNDDSTSTQFNAKPSLNKAKSEHIKLHLATCSKKDRGNICIEICHRPPGNPKNSKTLRLPLQATLAHLKHGHSSNPDTIGACDDNSEDDAEDDGDDHDCDNDDGSTSGDSSSGGSTSGGSDDDGTNTGGSDEGGGSGSDGSTSGGSDEGELSSGGGTTSGGTDDGSGSGDDGIVTIPDWCLVKYQQDKNCDGLDDITGESLY